jgi:hypothetical protein
VLFGSFKERLDEAAWTLRHMCRADLVSCLRKALKELEDGEDFNHLVETAAKRLIHTD